MRQRWWVLTFTAALNRLDFRALMNYLFMPGIFVLASVKLASAQFTLEVGEGVLGLISGVLTSNGQSTKETLQSSDVEAVLGV